MVFDHSKFLARFVEEAREHCARLTDGLLALEKSPDDAETLNALFRSAHTIKGSAKMMKLTAVGELAHAMEDALDAARGGRIQSMPAASELLFKGLDALSALLDATAAGEQAEAPGAICEELRRIAVGGGDDAQDGQKAEEPGKPEPPPSPDKDEPAGEVKTAAAAEEKRKDACTPQAAQYLRINAAKLDELIRLMGEIISDHSRFRNEIKQMRETALASARVMEAAASQLAKDPDRCPENRRLIDQTESLRQALRQNIASVSNAVMLQEHLIGGLQETSLRMRMQPLSTVFDPLRRTLREIAREYGKDIDFVVSGGETELDRKITERIGDSLLHMIRNSLDHGLESPEEREACGKPPRGTITLSAFYDGGGAAIALRDDGRGLATSKIKAKALAKRLFDQETLNSMSRAEINNLIFLPGFSTSPIITDLSGRGVGMDVVRKNIVDELKGAIIMESKEGQETFFMLRLPLNLAVFPLFLLKAGDIQCALSASSIEEVLAITHEEIIQIVDKRAIRLRERLVPVEDLAAILGREPKSSASDHKVQVCVVRDGESRLGLLVDDVLGREEMVVKPLPAHIQNLRLVTGCAVGSGNGVISVLHAPEVMRRAGELARPAHKAPTAEEEAGAKILVVDDSINTREIEKSILEAYGYHVETAEDGLEALTRTREALYDLVVTDVEMPRMDGFTLTARLRADERYRNVPVVIVTSREKDEDKQRGISVGADAYIVKRSFDQSNLLDTVRSLIG